MTLKAKNICSSQEGKSAIATTNLVYHKMRVLHEMFHLPKRHVSTIDKTLKETSKQEHFQEDKLFFFSTYEDIQQT